jgi:TonB family protein
MEMTVRQFALRQLSSRLAGGPQLVSALWNEIGGPAERPDLTVVYCVVRRLGQSFALFEFVAGETLEELVRRSDPDACELEIPLFCRILDAFEGGERDASEVPNAEPAAPADLELLDFGLARASAAFTSKVHGTVLGGPDNAWEDVIFGEYGAGRSQVLAALMEICAKLPGDLPRTASNGAAPFGGLSIRSLAGEVREQAPSREPALPVETPATAKRLGALLSTVAPYLIAVITMALVLLTFYGVGGYLAKRTVPADAGKLMLPPMPAEPPEPNLEISEPISIPVAGAKLRQQAASGKPVAERRTRAPKQPIPSIVLLRGARPLRQTSLEYPAEAAKEHVTGLVEMQFTIAEDGSVQSPRVLSGDPLLRAGLTEEVSHWVYQPLRVNGKPVAMTTEMAIRFNLN